MIASSFGVVLAVDLPFNRSRALLQLVDVKQTGADTTSPTTR